MIKRFNLKNNKGVSLIETLIAVSIFCVVMLIMLESFISVIKLNRESANAQNLQDNVRFLYEVMSKEIKMAKKCDNTCSCFGGKLNNKVYFVEEDNLGDDVLYFWNYKGACVKYYVDHNEALGHDRLRIERDGNSMYVMPKDIEFANMSIDLVGDFDSAIHTPYSITMYMDLENITWDPARMGIQTTISSRYIE